MYLYFQHCTLQYSLYDGRRHCTLHYSRWNLPGYIFTLRWSAPDWGGSAQPAQPAFIGSWWRHGENPKWKRNRERTDFAA